jgi:hypothetical protein
MKLRTFDNISPAGIQIKEARVPYTPVAVVPFPAVAIPGHPHVTRQQRYAKRLVACHNALEKCMSPIKTMKEIKAFLRDIASAPELPRYMTQRAERIFHQLNS